jgi:hypothetical protein
MRQVHRSEILPIGDYEQIRPHFRARVIAEKRLRRQPVGDFISVLFENRDTVLCQVQEMLRAERITSEPAIIHELNTYNALIPAAGQLSMTLFVEIADAAVREQTLVDLAGLEDAVRLEVDGERFAAQGNFAGVVPGRTTAVHYFKFTLSSAAAAKVAQRQAAVAVVIDHPKQQLRRELPAETLVKLAEDLAEDLSAA